MNQTVKGCPQCRTAVPMIADYCPNCGRPFSSGLTSKVERSTGLDHRIIKIICLTVVIVTALLTVRAYLQYREMSKMTEAMNATTKGWTDAMNRSSKSGF